MDLQAKYDWTNKVALAALNNLKASAYAVYKYALDHDPKLFQQLIKPQVGDLVLEITAYGLNPRQFQNLGYLREDRGNGCYLIELLDGDMQSWTNCKFIKILT